MYGPFTNEELVGEAIKGKRDGLVIATKFAMRWNGNEMAGLDGTPENARRACEGSLRRLGIETIDLFYQHRVDPNVPIEETVGGMAELVREGKVRFLGLSEAGRKPFAGHMRSIPSLPCNPNTRCGSGMWRPTSFRSAANCGSGSYLQPARTRLPTGQFRSRADLPEGDWRFNDPRYSEENFGANLKIVQAIRTVADRHGVSLAQVALAWLLAQGEDVVPIPGFKRRATLEDSIASLDLQLSGEDFETLEAAAPRGGTSGPRYGERGMRMVRL
jgi:aryl-alcohol dehydrogenase-like predicted oxidoreductase